MYQQLKTGELSVQIKMLSVMRNSHSEVTTLPHIKWFCYNANNKLVVPSSICFSNIFSEDTAGQLNALNTMIPFLAPFINLAMAEPTMLHMHGNYIVSKTDPQMTRFFLLGVTTFLSVLSGSTAHSISVAFLDHMFLHVIAILGAVLDRKRFLVNMYQG